MEPRTARAAHFTDAQKAREYLERVRWGAHGPVCPVCGGADPYSIVPGPGSSTRPGLYKCRVKECRSQFTVTIGSVLEDSRIPLNKWLQAVHLVTASANGISAQHLHQALAINYRSARLMVHRLRQVADRKRFERQAQDRRSDTAQAEPSTRTTNEKPLKIKGSFTSVVRQLLTTPPALPSSFALAAKTKAWRREVRSTAHRLKTRFDAVHRQGIQALRSRDFAGLARAIKLERELINAQKAFIVKQRRLMQPRQFGRK